MWHSIKKIKPQHIYADVYLRYWKIYNRILLENQ